MCASLAEKCENYDPLIGKVKAHFTLTIELTSIYKGVSNVAYGGKYL